MFGRIIFSAVLSGLVVGLILTGIQRFQVVPIILEAETYEGAGDHAHGAEAEGAPTDEQTPTSEPGGLYASIMAFQNAEAAWEPGDGGERMLYTAIANVLIAIGFGLLLAAIFSLRKDIGVVQGLLWGIGGYLTFFV